MKHVQLIFGTACKPIGYSIILVVASSVAMTCLDILIQNDSYNVETGNNIHVVWFKD